MSSRARSGRRPPRRGRTAGHVAQQLAHGPLEVPAMRHAVEHAVVEEELGRLESYREVLTEGLLDAAWAGEADYRARLGENGVAEHGVARADAARRRIGENRDVRDAPLRKLGEHFRDLGHARPAC